MGLQIKSFRDLVVWQKAMNLVELIYALTKQFPADERYALTSQVKRASVSVPSNIAEGYGRDGTKDYLRFLNISLSSLFELQTQLEISMNLEYLKKDRSVVFAILPSSAQISLLTSGTKNQSKSHRLTSHRHRVQLIRWQRFA